MKHGPRIQLRIGNLRVTGVTRAEAAALASSLRQTLSERLAVAPDAVQNLHASHLQLTLPSSTKQAPTALGQVAGQQIAAALTAAKGGK